MEFLKNLFKNEERVVGLCAFNKKNSRVSYYSYTPQFNAPKLIYNTNTKNNFFLL